MPLYSATCPLPVNRIKNRLNKNLILNSKFDANNDYPFDGFDANYFAGGALVGGSSILGNYYHNSPLFYMPLQYRTIANKTFHEINSPYDILLYNHPLKPRLLKMFGVGSRFGSLNGTDYLKTVTSTTSFTPSDSESWAKYGVEQLVAIPSWANKVIYGVEYLGISGDLFRPINFGGLKLNFYLGTNRNYVNIHLIRRSTITTAGVIVTAAVDALESLYGAPSNVYLYFNANSGSNAMGQWLGPSTTRVKVRKRSSTNIDSNADKFVKIYDQIDIPTFSSSGPLADSGDGRPDTVSLEMFFAESVAYLNDSGLPSGAIYFYRPFLYFAP